MNPKLWDGSPTYLRKQQSALAGLETLSAGHTQLGVPHLSASVGVGKSTFGHQGGQLHSNHESTASSFVELKQTDSCYAEPWVL